MCHSKAKPQIIIDTRQQPNKHRLKHSHFEAVGFELVRAKLDYGDYAFPNHKVAIDTKRNIAELAANVQKDHERFRRECLRAQEAGGALVILVENTQGVRVLKELARWHEPKWQTKKRRSRYPIQGKRIAETCYTMGHRYGVLFAFCSPHEAGARVLSILEHEEETLQLAKAAIKNGE